ACRRGPRRDGRVGLAEPGPDFGGVLVPGLAAGPLGGVAPAAAVRADGPHRPGAGTCAADQSAHGTTRPERRGDTQLFGGRRVDALLEGGGRFGGQGTARTAGAAGAVGGQRVHAAGGVSGPPAGEGFAGDAAEVGAVGWGEAKFTAGPGTEPEDFADFIRQGTRIRPVDS